MRNNVWYTTKLLTIRILQQQYRLRAINFSGRNREKSIMIAPNFILGVAIPSLLAVQCLAKRSN